MALALVVAVAVEVAVVVLVSVTVSVSSLALALRLGFHLQPPGVLQGVCGGPSILNIFRICSMLDYPVQCHHARHIMSKLIRHMLRVQQRVYRSSQV